MWAIVDGDRILATYQREASARLNANGRDVEEVEQTDPRLNPAPYVREPADYAEARRREYAKIDLGEQLELITEALVAIASGSSISAATLAKAQSLSARIAAIKAAHPKP
jgi:hypothetical protein